MLLANTLLVLLLSQYKVSSLLLVTFVNLMSYIYLTGFLHQSHRPHSNMPPIMLEPLKCTLTEDQWAEEDQHMASTVLPAVLSACSIEENNPCFVFWNLHILLQSVWYQIVTVWLQSQETQGVWGVPGQTT